MPFTFYYLLFFFSYFSSAMSLPQRDFPSYLRPSLSLSPPHFMFFTYPYVTLCHLCIYDTHPTRMWALRERALHSSLPHCCIPKARAVPGADRFSEDCEMHSKICSPFLLVQDQDIFQQPAQWILAKWLNVEQWNVSGGDFVPFWAKALPQCLYTLSTPSLSHSVWPQPGRCQQYPREMVWKELSPWIWMVTWNSYPTDMDSSLCNYYVKRRKHFFWMFFECWRIVIL